MYRGTLTEQKYPSDKVDGMILHSLTQIVIRFLSFFCHTLALARLLLRFAVTRKVLKDHFQVLI